jgi:16S rRNA (cytosine1402-N4)-methyltransferase
VNGNHVPVLLEEAVAALEVKPSGVYVDATFGRGGHARAILARLGETGRLVAIDRDPSAIPAAETLAASDSRFTFRRAWFSELPDVLDALALAQVDGASSISESPRRRSTTPRAASLIAWMVRST